MDSAEDLVSVFTMLMDRKFDSQYILEHISQRNLQYVVPKRMRTSEKETARRLNECDIDRRSIN